MIARVASDRRPEIGETVRVSADAEHAYFFDAATGESLGLSMLRDRERREYALMLAPLPASGSRS